MKLWPNRSKQFEGHALPLTVLAGGLLLAGASVVGWIEPATRTQRGAVFGILLLTPFLLYRLGEQLVRPVIRIKATGVVWWTIQRRSGEISANELQGFRIVGIGEDQVVQLEHQSGQTVEIPIQPIAEPDQFVLAVFDRLGLQPIEARAELEEPDA